MKTRRSIALILLLGFMLILSGSVFGADIDDLENKQKETEQKIEEKEQEKKAVTEQKQATMADLESLEATLEGLSAEIAELDIQLQQANEDLARQEEELVIIQDNLAKSQLKMKNRVTSIYVNGDVSYWDVLFNSNSLTEFLSNFVYFESIVEQNQKIVNDIKENKRLAQEKLDELEQTKSNIEGITASKKAQEADYQVQADAKSQLVGELSAQEDTLSQLMAEFEAESQRITAEIQDYYEKQRAAQEAAKNGGGGSAAGVYDSPEYTGNGQFGHPLGGKGRQSQGYHGGHNAVDLATPTGTPVLASESGVVILVKRLYTSYGHYVIIDHGGGYTTLYAHMSSIGVSVGQKVSRGQQIGLSGNTGRSTGPHLHFEVRVNGVARNPLNYI